MARWDLKSEAKRWQLRWKSPVLMNDTSSSSVTLKLWWYSVDINSSGAKSMMFWNEVIEGDDRDREVLFREEESRWWFGLGLIQIFSYPQVWVSSIVLTLLESGGSKDQINQSILSVSRIIQSSQSGNPFAWSSDRQRAMVRDFILTYQWLLLLGWYTVRWRSELEVDDEVLKIKRTFFLSPRDSLTIYL